jgi:hypothetical protein
MTTEDTNAGSPQDMPRPRGRLLAIAMMVLVGGLFVLVISFGGFSFLGYNAIYLGLAGLIIIGAGWGLLLAGMARMRKSKSRAGAS